MESTLQKVSRLVFAIGSLVAVGLAFLGLLLPLSENNIFIWSVLAQIIKTIGNVAANKAATGSNLTYIIDYSVILIIYSIFSIMIIITGVKLIVLSIMYIKGPNENSNKNTFLKFLGVLSIYTILLMALFVRSDVGAGLTLSSTATSICVAIMLASYILKSIDDGQRGKTLAVSILTASSAFLLASGAMMLVGKSLESDDVVLSLSFPFFLSYTVAINNADLSGGMILALIAYLFAFAFSVAAAITAIEKTKNIIGCKENEDSRKGLMTIGIISSVLAIIGGIFFLIGTQGKIILRGDFFSAIAFFIGSFVCIIVANSLSKSTSEYKQLESKSEEQEFGDNED